MKTFLAVKTFPKYTNVTRLRNSANLDIRLNDSNAPRTNNVPLIPFISLRRILSTMSANGGSHVYILITCIPCNISFIKRTRLSVRCAVFKRNEAAFLPNQTVKMRDYIFRLLLLNWGVNGGVGDLYRSDRIIKWVMLNIYICSNTHFVKV